MELASSGLFANLRNLTKEDTANMDILPCEWNLLFAPEFSNHHWKMIVENTENANVLLGQTILLVGGLVLHTESVTLSATHMHFIYLKELDLEIILTCSFNYVITLFPRVIITNILRACVFLTTNPVFVTVVNRKDSAKNGMTVSNIVIRQVIVTC